MENSLYVLIGRWTFAAREKGLTVCRLDSETGELLPQENYFADTNVGCIHVDGEKGLIFMADERDGLRGTDAGSGYILTARIFPGGQMELISEVPSLACNPTYICPDWTGKYVFAAHHGLRKNHATRVVRDPEGGWRTEVVYDQAPLMLFRLEADGKLGELCDVWAESPEWSRPGWRPHLHFVSADPGGRLYIVTDPGTDSVFSFHLDTERGKLEPLHKLTIETGKMPRYAAFHPTAPLFYANNERGSLVNIFRYDTADGSMERAGSCDQLLEPGGEENEPSDIRISPDGRFLYGAVRGADLLTVMAVAADGSLRAVQNLSCGGRGPRGICLSPDGRFLICANQHSHNVTVFRIGGNGRLAPASELSISDPGCPAFWGPKISYAQ